MPNYLFNQYGKNGQYENIINQFNQFRSSFKGDPKQKIQQMLNSGKISQAQYNDAVQKANALARMLGMK